MEKVYDMITPEGHFRFEFDDAKSRVNRTKHGIDFRAAQMLWLDEQRIEVAARPGSEERRIFVGRISDKMWSAVITYRDRRIRIISVRRSRPREVADYEG